MKKSRRTVLELAAVAGALALLAGASLLLTRLLVPGPVPAPDVPDAVEKALRPLLLARIRQVEAVVEDPAVALSFRLMTARLRDGLSAAGGGPAPAESLPEEVLVIVLESPTTNAMSLPGGLIVVYTDLLKRLDGAEQMAAILAHEMGHAAHRDSFRLLARQVGLSMLASTLSGGSGESAVQAVLREAVGLRYSREAEDAADAFALALLPASGIDPAAFADALRAIKGSAGRESRGILRYLDAHEDIDKRIRRAEDASLALKASGRFEARALTTDWDALKARLPSDLEPRP